jgi:hypothetical protein
MFPNKKKERKKGGIHASGVCETDLVRYPQFFSMWKQDKTEVNCIQNNLKFHDNV